MRADLVLRRTSDNVSSREEDVLRPQSASHRCKRQSVGSKAVLGDLHGNDLVASADDARRSHAIYPFKLGLYRIFTYRLELFEGAIALDG